MFKSQMGHSVPFYFIEVAHRPDYTWSLDLSEDLLPLEFITKNSAHPHYKTAE